MKVMSNFQFKFKLQKIVKESNKQDQPVSILGLDLGTQQTGIARTDQDIRYAYGVDVYRNKYDSKYVSLTENPRFYQFISQAVQQNNAKGIVFGLNMQRQGSTDWHNQQFIKMMAQIYKDNPTLIITSVDESGTSKIAHAITARIEQDYELRGRLMADKEINDQIASMLILQKYCDYFNGI